MNDQTFEFEVKKYDRLLVLFYMPHSEVNKEFAVKYSEAAKTLHDMTPPHYLAKVNDGENPYVATHHHISDTPSLRWFVGGKEQNITLNHTMFQSSEDIVDWVLAQSND